LKVNQLTDLELPLKVTDYFADRVDLPDC